MRPALTNSRLYPRRFSDRYAHLVCVRNALVQLSRQHLRGKSGLVLVDLGCGSMPYRPLFEEYVTSFIGADLPTNPTADVVLGQDSFTGLQDASCDIVLSTQVLEHVQYPERYLAESIRILRPGGLLFLSTHGYWPYHPDPTDYWRWTGDGLRHILQGAGYRVEAWRGVMSLAATSLQLFQDAMVPKLPGKLRAPLAAAIQPLILLLDRVDSPSGRSNDACVFVAVARKPATPDGLSNAGELPAGPSECGRPVPEERVQEPSLRKRSVSPRAGGGFSVAVIRPSRDAYSETFIRAHVERLPCRVREWHGGWFPTHDELNRPLASLRQRILQRGLRMIGADPARYMARVLAQDLKRKEINVVLAEYGPTGAAVMRACCVGRIPLVVHFHGFDAYDEETLKASGRSYGELFTIASTIIAVSRHMEQRLLDLGAPATKLVYIPYGVDTSDFAAGNPTQAPPLFLAAGRFVDKKAPHLTLLAFERVLKECPEARLVMAGDGPLLGSCRQLARALSLAGAVSFPGALPHGSVAILLRKARAFVQHSVVAASGDSEGTPVAVIEAAATGLPVVSTNHAGIPDVVVDGETGFLVNEGDVEGMARKMLDLAVDPLLAARLGAAGRARAIDLFSMESSIDRLWRVLVHASVWGPTGESALKCPLSADFPAAP